MTVTVRYLGEARKGIGKTPDPSLELGFCGSCARELVRKPSASLPERMKGVLRKAKEGIDSRRNLVAMSEVLEDDLEEVYQFAIDLAKSSGKILLEGLERRRVTEDDCAPEVIEKLNAVDIVTQTDTGTYAIGTTSQNWSMRTTLTRSRCRNIHSLCNPEQVPETRLSWRRDIFQRLIEGISHPKWSNLGRRSARWHSELHPC